MSVLTHKPIVRARARSSSWPVDRYRAFLSSQHESQAKSRSRFRQSSAVMDGDSVGVDVALHECSLKATDGAFNTLSDATKDVSGKVPGATCRFSKVFRVE